MTIRPGEEWGEPVATPPDLVRLDGDADLADAVMAGRREPLGLSAGDLHRTLGAPARRAMSQRVPIDAIKVRGDGIDSIAVAHVVARLGWWRGPIVAAMNADHLGSWYVAPRAHPNDGRVDIVEVDTAMSVRDRWAARSRLASGSHVPHPCITTRSAREATWEFARAMRIVADGRELGRSRHLNLVVEPDAFDLFI